MTNKLDKIKSNIVKSAELISKSKKVVLMTGAGISVDSGIPTFQGTEGLWSRFGKPKMNAFSEFIKNKDSWWDREINHQRSPYVMELRKAIEKAKPNDAHYAICDIQKLGKINHIITQNIDGLHIESGSKNVIEIHGNRNYLRCIDCENRFRFSSPIFEKPLPCSNCGGVIKYDSVMFGEPIPKLMLKNSKNAIKECDLLIIIGSSSTVRPAAGLSWIAKSDGAKLIEVNINDTKLSSECEIILRGSSTDILPKLYKEISSL